MRGAGILRPLSFPILLKSVKDPHIVEFGDHGIDRDGNPTGNRQALMRALSKRVTATVDGKEHILPIFLVEKVGPWLDPFGKRMDESKIPDTDDWRSFEDDVINREHSEEMLARWKKAQCRAKSAKGGRMSDKDVPQRVVEKMTEQIKKSSNLSAEQARKIARESAERVNRERRQNGGN